LESGKTPLRDVVLLRRLADLFGMPAEEFGLCSGDRPPKVRDRRITPSIVVPIAPEQEDSVHRRELLSGLVGLAGMSALPGRSTAMFGRTTTVDALRRRLGQARASFDACQYRDVATAVPDIVLAGHQLVADATPGQQRERYTAVLADGYCLASFLADKLGDYGLAWLMADRARSHALNSGNPTCVAAATREAAVATRRASYFDRAVSMLTTTADELPTDTANGLAARGCLLLTAAYTEAQQGNRAQAMELITDAERVARYLPVHRSAESIFTPAQVALYSVGVHNALGDYARALTAARSITLTSLPSVERQVKLCLDVARARLGHGDAAGSFTALCRAEQLAPEDARRPSVQVLTRQLLEKPGHAPNGLMAFAYRIGVS
jgi:hypothetical protein